ncbi:hypothetical protein RCL_jg4381.t1 [Rhizophagus clarus]|uniref:Uncharacterized protein n=1 Tax=Rhizophagus clarus TaxID=94130 RepID=A0A8H3KTR8_9GLOM|nr:hypothetical protein RCL_jg4381.t1 [Rhizophagus clarus]
MQNGIIFYLKSLNKSRTEMKKNAKRDLHCTCIRWHKLKIFWKMIFSNKEKYLFLIGFRFSAIQLGIRVINNIK